MSNESYQGRERRSRREEDRLERDLEELTEAVRRLTEALIKLQTEFTIVKAIVFGFAIIVLTSFAAVLTYVYIPRPTP